jgi:hypothetical protein
MPRRQTSSSVPMLGTSTVIFRNSLGAPSSAQIVTRRLLRLPGSKALSFAWVIRKRTSVFRDGQYRVTDWSSLNKSYKTLQGSRVGCPR